MRLQRALARAGVASRRAAEDLIRGARVQVNGETAHLGMSVNPDSDVITVQGRRITQPRTVWIALNKPIGYVVTRRDPEGRDTVFRLVPDAAGLTYVGRLDVMTTGLLLLTNDGDAAHRLMHPRFAVERTYRAVVHGRSEAEIRGAFDRGIVIDERKVNVKSLKIRPSEEHRGSLEILLVLAEGRYRIVRRIADQLGLKVERLTRLSYGPIRLGDLPPGTWRYLEPGEIEAIGRGTTSTGSGSRWAEKKSRTGSLPRAQRGGLADGRMEKGRRIGGSADRRIEKTRRIGESADSRLDRDRETSPGRGKRGKPNTSSRKKRGKRGKDGSKSSAHPPIRPSASTTKRRSRRRRDS